MKNIWSIEHILLSKRLDFQAKSQSQNRRSKRQKAYLGILQWSFFCWENKETFCQLLLLCKESLLKTTRTQEIISTLWWKEDAFVWHILHWNDGVSVSSITIKVLPAEHRESHSSTHTRLHPLSTRLKQVSNEHREILKDVWIINFCIMFDSLW